MVSIVITTINVPLNIPSIINNVEKYGHDDVVTILIVGDVRTPKGIGEYLKKHEVPTVKIIYLDLADQEKFMKDFKSLNKLIPLNSIQRRNIGYLYALHLGSEIIITMDDDNFVTDKDFIRYHSICGSPYEGKHVNSRTHWFNPCKYLNVSDKRVFYHRGYPLRKRWIDDEESFYYDISDICCNVGYWLGDPDIDTFERLTKRYTVTGAGLLVEGIVLGPSVYTVFSSQNTSFTRAALCAYYLVSVGNEYVPYRASHTNFRYDDIWASLFMLKIAHKLGESIKIGEPFVRQNRNNHDFVRDLCREHVPLVFTDYLSDILEEIDVQGENFLECYYNLTRELEYAIDYNHSVLVDEDKIMLRHMVKGMYAWVEACSKII